MEAIITAAVIGLISALIVLFLSYRHYKATYDDSIVVDICNYIWFIGLFFIILLTSVMEFRKCSTTKPTIETTTIIQGNDTTYEYSVVWTDEEMEIKK